MDDYLIALALVVLSALFSGLTLGLFSLDTHTLRRRANLGDADAIKLYPIRQKGNQLLTTLLFGNVAVNTILSVYLGSIASGVAASIMATTLIFLFGEIIPQAVMSRHAMYFGPKLAPLVQILLLVCAPIAYPIGKLLDRVLGEEIPMVHSKQELMQIVSEHEDSDHSTIDADEERIIHGALQFSHRRVDEVMTPLEQVVMFPATQRLDHAFFEQVTEEGFSRYPIYDEDRSRIVGLLFARDLLTEDEHITIRETEEAFDEQVLRVRPHELLDVVLGRMLKQKRHLAIVERPAGTALGIITLEDIIEEIIQFEIEDEDD